MWPQKTAKRSVGYLEVLVEEAVEDGVGDAAAESAKESQGVPDQHVAVPVGQEVAEEVVDEAVDHDRRPAEEEGDGDRGHEDVGPPTTPVRGLVLARRSGEQKRERETHEVD